MSIGLWMVTVMFTLLAVGFALDKRTDLGFASIICALLVMVFA